MRFTREDFAKAAKAVARSNPRAKAHRAERLARIKRKPLLPGNPLRVRKQEANAQKIEALASFPSKHTIERVVKMLDDPAVSPKQKVQAAEQILKMTGPSDVSE